MSIEDAPTDAPDRTASRPAAGRRRSPRWLRVLAWVVAIAVWVVVCFTWLFPWFADLGFDPTLVG